MIDTFIELTQNAEAKFIMVAVGVMALWLFVKSIRWILNFCIILTLIFVVVWKVPPVQTFFLSFLR